MSSKKIYRMKVEKKPYKCKKCGRGFTQNRYLKAHLIKKVPCDKKFICTKCKREFNNNSGLSAHLNRATPCVTDEIPVIDSTKNEHRCQYCNGTYANKQNLKRHQKTCDKEANLHYMMKILIEQNEKQRDMIETLITNGGIIPAVTNNVTINNTQNILNNNIYVNVTICSFGKEDLSKLDTSKVMNLLKGQVDDFMPKMIEHVHANPDHPEFHNVFFDPELGKAIVFAPISDTEMSWQSRDFAEVSADITEKIKEHIRPGNMPYFDTAMQDRDSDTANNIINIRDKKWNGHSDLIKNKESLSIVTENKEFLKLVNVKE